MTNQQNFYAAVNGQVGQGKNVAQTQQNGIDAAVLAEIFKTMRTGASTVEDPDDRQDVEHSIQQLEMAAKSGDVEAISESGGRLKRLADRIGGAALTAATSQGMQHLFVAAGIS